MLMASLRFNSDPGALQHRVTTITVHRPTGHCDVIATWNGTHKTVPVSWKNYPYLSVKTSVNPLTIEINNTN